MSNPPQIHGHASRRDDHRERHTHFPANRRYQCSGEPRHHSSAAFGAYRLATTGIRKPNAAQVVAESAIPADGGAKRWLDKGPSMEQLRCHTRNLFFANYLIPEQIS